MCCDELTGDHEGLLILAVLQVVLLFVKLKFLLGIIIVHLFIVLTGQEFGPIAHARSAVGLGGIANLVIVIVTDLVVELELLVGIVVVVDPTALALIVGC